MRPAEEAFTTAAQFRVRHRLGFQPLGDLVALIEQATGIDVAVLDVDDAHGHGLTARDPERDVMFLGVAGTPNPMRQRSTLAHEPAHIVFNDWADHGGGNRDRRSNGELRAGAFAGRLLIPRPGLRESTPMTAPWMIRRCSRMWCNGSWTPPKWHSSPWRK